MQASSTFTEDIINKGSEILSLIRHQFIQKHFTNILCCHIESFHIILLQNPWVRSLKQEEDLSQIFKSVMNFMSKIKKLLGELENGEFFKEIGQNKGFWTTISAMVSLFESITKLFKDTSLHQKLQEEDLNFQNLEHELGFIDAISVKLKEKFKDYKSLIRPSNNFPPGELTIIFDLSSMANDECTISWLTFSSKLTSFILELTKIELKPHHLTQIRKMVDSLKVSAISFDNLNYFFNYLWIKASERRSILNPQEPKNQSEIYASVILDEYPILHLTLNQTKTIKIHPRGFDHPSNTNYRGDGITYFGRKSQLNLSLNDVNLNEADLTVSRRQFQIVYQEEKKRYVILCISNSNPTMFRMNKRMRLKLGSLFQLSDTQIFKVEAISYKKEKNPAQYLQTPEEVKKKFNNDMNNQGPAARKALENKIDVLAESMYLSVLGLDPPDVEKTANNTNRTMPMKFDENETKFTKDIKIMPLPIKKEAPQDFKQNAAPFIEIVCLKGHHENVRRLSVGNPKISQVFSIGRKHENDIIIDSQDLSSVHCQLMFDAQKDAWYIGEKLTKFQEKNSFNGTFLFCKDFAEYTMKRPSQAKNLKEGMVIRVGANELSVHFEDSE